MMNRGTFFNFLRLLALVSLFTIPAPGGLAAPGVQAASGWQNKVDPQVLAQAAEGKSEFLVVMNEQANLRAAADLPDKQAKGQYVYETLTRLAARSQAGALRSLHASGAQTRSYWIANIIWVRGNLPAVQAAASRSDVQRVIANPWVRGDLGQAAAPTNAAVEATSLLAPDLTVEWNLTHVGAPQAWAAGHTGAGVVIAGQDTGYDWDHPALKTSYRGWNGSQADHNYNWHDAIHEEISAETNPCGLDAAAPCDDHGHGTHTMGTMVGDDAGLNYRVGMAPGARWIGCRNMESGYGKPSTYIECYEWFVAPTDLNNQNPDPALAPDIINNSWGCPPAEGCTDPLVMQTVVNNVTAAGILTVHSAGNSGSACGTVSDPAAIYSSSFTVGNTTSLDSLASTSSRGPVTVDGSGRRKPDISAPGTSIRSSIPGTGYTYMSGTSMAGPHVAGLAALLISTNPGLAGQPDTLRRIMEQTANPNVSAGTQVCGGTSAADIPNTLFGWGRIDATAAVELAGLTPTIQAPITSPGGEALISITTSNRMAAGSGLDLTPVSLQAAIPPETTFITATLPHVRSGEVITWTVGTLPAGGTFTATITLGAPDVVYAAYPVQAAAANGSAQTGPALTTLIVSALQPRLRAENQATYGSPISYTLRISNTHAAENLLNLAANSTLPDGAALVNSSEAYTLDNGVLGWQRAALGPGENWEIVFSLLPGPEAWLSGPLASGSYSVQAQGIPALSGPAASVTLQPPRQIFLPVIRH